VGAAQDLAKQQSRSERRKVKDKRSAATYSITILLLHIFYFDVCFISLCKKKNNIPQIYLHITSKMVMSIYVLDCRNIKYYRLGV